jgi:hypothetical protein
MTLKSLRLGLLAGLVLPLGLAGAALAQPAAPSPAPSEAQSWRDHDRGATPAERQARMAERQARMAQRMRDALQLQPNQQGALAAWLAALRPSPGEAEEPRGDEAGETKTTPQRLDDMLAHVDRMRARLAQTADATKRFYAQLSPAQQKAFDAMSPMMMRHMGGWGGRGMDGRGKEGPDGGPHRGWDGDRDGARSDMGAEDQPEG